MALIRQIELVIGEEDGDARDSALRRRGDRLLELVEHDLERTVLVLAAEIRRQAVDALHRAADPRPHRKRVDRRVERLAERRPTGERQLVGVERVGVAAPDETRDRSELRAGGETVEGEPEGHLAGADDSPLDLEVVEALARKGGEGCAAAEEERLGAAAPSAARSRGSPA